MMAMIKDAIPEGPGEGSVALESINSVFEDAGVVVPFNRARL